MNKLSDFIVANLGEAEAILAAEGEHADKWKVFEAKDLLPEDLAPLHFLISNKDPFGPPNSTEVALDYDKPFENALEEYAAFAFIAADEEGRQVLLEVPRSLVLELATLLDAEVLAREWFSFPSPQMTAHTVFNERELQAILENLQKVARQAMDRKASLLLWLCLG